MSLQAVQCPSCGGAVAFSAGAPEPRCLFCGAAGLVETPVPEGIEAPEGFLPFALSEEDARAAFRKFAASSIWYPSDLRHARLKLSAVLLPAWDWAGRVETHWAALVPAATRSGKRPVAGLDHLDTSGVLIPSSQALSHTELRAISPYHSAEFRPASETGLPYEMGSLTRTAAQREAIEGMENIHAAKIKAAVSAATLRTSVVVHNLVGRPLLLPVWVGAFRRGEKVYRIVVNGQTGALTGKAPLSVVKIALAVFAVVALLTAFVVVFGITGWVASRPR